MQKEIESYRVRAEQIEITVKIISGKRALPSYELIIPELAPATKALLDEIRSLLVTEVTISTAEMLDPNSINVLKEKFSRKALAIIQLKLPRLEEDVRTYLIGVLLQEMLGLGYIEFLLNDQALEEIVITSAKEPVRVYHKKYGWLETNIIIHSEDQIQNYSSIIARRVGRQITTLTPLLDAHLVTGDRANSVLYPICTKGNTITIRKFARDPWTVTDFINMKTCPAEIFALIWHSIQYEMNILVSGGTASGKCITGDTKIHLTDGKIIPIKSIIEEQFKTKKIQKNEGWEYVYADSLNVLSLDTNSLKITKKPVSKVWRHKTSDKLIKIKTRSGREIITTPEHPFFTLEDGSLTKIRADEIKNKTRIAVPRFLPIENKNDKPDLINYIKNEKHVYVHNETKMLKERVVPFLLKKYNCVSTEKLSRIFGYNKYTFRSWKYENAIPLKEYYALLNESQQKPSLNMVLKGKTNGNLTKIPSLTPELFRFVALVISDGHLTKTNTQFFNSDMILLQEFLDIGKRLFGLEGRIEYPRNRVTKAVIHSPVLSKLLNKAFQIPYGNKARKVVAPNLLFEQDINSIAEFISGIIDCEGYVGKSEIEIGLSSKTIITGLATLFLRLGILTSVRERKGQHFRLFINGYENFSKLGLINLRHRKKLSKFNILLERKKQLTHNIDTIPIMSNWIKNLRLDKNLTQKQFAQEVGVSRRLVGMWENGVRNLSINTFNQLIDFTEEEYPKMSVLAESDIFWDEIMSVEVLTDHKEEYVYDLTVEENHNFLAGDIPLIVHNTSFLNVILPFIPPNQRIISIEDTRELQLSEHLYWCPLVTRQPNPEGKGEVSMLDLLVNSLRMRPDRIILGEMRRKDQAQVLFEAMHTGHSVYATVHADTIGETIKRLIHPPIEVPSNLLSAVNLNVVMFRDRRKGLRRVLQVGEYIVGEEGEETTIKPNILYRWKPDKDEIVQHSESLRLKEELSKYTGMTQKEVEQELKNKEKILNWLVKQKIRGIEQIGKVLNAYYTDPDNILQMAEKNKPFNIQ